MLNGSRVCVVMPGYRAETTLEKTVAEIPTDVVDDVILVDDSSPDRTAEIGRSLGVHTLVHPENRGYGANQKTCYREALRRGADIVVMVHPDYQYTPRLIPALATCVASGLYDAALGSRILGVGARAGGMPLYKYVSNRALTLFQNLVIGYKLSEYHTGYRAFSRDILLTLPLEENDDDFIFDNQMLAQAIHFGFRVAEVMLAQAIHFGFRVAEVTCPTRYDEESSSIDFRRSVRYGLGVVWTSLRVRAARMGLLHPRFLSPDGRKLELEAP
jgi:glycosyltransferase involved in cell wall biosynthesis